MSVIDHGDVGGGCMSYLKQLDDSAWPIVYARFQGTSTIEDFATFVTWYAAQVARAQAEHTRFISIADTRGSTSVAPDVRRYIAERLGELQAPHFKAATLATLVVVDSLLIRGVMTALSWVSREQMAAVTSHASLDDAWREASAIAAAAGLHIPARPPWANEHKALSS